MAGAKYNLNFEINAEDSASTKFKKFTSELKEVREEIEKYKKELQDALKEEDKWIKYDIMSNKPEGLDLRTKAGKAWKKDQELTRNLGIISARERIDDSSLYLGELENREEELKANIKRQQELMVDEAKKKYSELASIVKSSFSKMTRFIKSYLSLLKKLAQPLTNFIKKLNKQADVAKRVEKAFTSISHVFRYMVLRMTFRQALKNFGTFFGKLLQFSEETAVKFNELYNAIVKLQVTVVASVAPIIQAFSSMFAGIVNIITRLVTILNQLTSALFNNSKTYIRAKDTALDYRDALEEAGGAANKVLAPFDKINQLGSAKGGAGKTGLEGLNPADIFEEAPIDKPIESFADRLRKAFEDKTFFDNFNLEGFGHNLMAKLESALKSISAIDVGNFIGSLGNAITNFMFGFVDEWHPELWADFIIDVITTACKKFDFNKLQEFYKTLFGKLADFLSKINNALAKSNAGSKAAEWVNGILPKMSELAYELGRFIGEAISQAADFVLGLDTQGIVDVITNFVKGATENGKLTKLVEALFKLLYAAILALAESAGTMISGNPGATAALIGIMAVWIGATIGAEALKMKMELAMISWIAGVPNAGLKATFSSKLSSIVGMLSKDTAIFGACAPLGEWLLLGVIAGLTTALSVWGAEKIANALKDSLGMHTVSLTDSKGGLTFEANKTKLSQAAQNELNKYKFGFQIPNSNIEILWDESGNGVMFREGEKIGESLSGGIDKVIGGYFSDPSTNAILKSMENVESYAKEKGALVGDGFAAGASSKYKEMKEAGEYVTKGFGTGLDESLKKLNPDKKFEDYVNKPAFNALQLGSPSKLYKQYGEWVIEGFNNGLGSKKVNIDIFTNFAEDSKTSLGTFVTFYETFSQNIVSLTEQLANSLASGINSIGNSMVKMMSIAIDSMKEAVAEYNAAASAAGEPTIYYNATKPKWTALKTDNKLTIPKLATGAVLPANKPFLSVVGDQKHGTNVEAPLDTIKQALREVQGEGNTSRPTNLTIECDKRVLGKLFVDLGNEESRRVGSKFVTI